MAALICPETVRYAVKGTIHDRPWVNIWDVRFAEGRPAADSSIAAKAVTLLDGYYTYFRTVLSAEWKVEGVSWVDLNSANGGVGSINDTPTNTFPATGSGSTGAMPGNVAVLIRKNVPAGRGARNGRCFVPGFNESAIADNKLATTTQNTFNINLANFLNAMNADIGGFTAQLGVVHQPANGAPYFTAAVSLVAELRVATLRRRLRG